MIRHKLARLHFCEMDAGSLAGTVRESAVAWSRETAFVAGGDVGGLDASHRGNVDYGVGSVGCGTALEFGIKANSRVVHCFDIERVDLVPPRLWKVVVGGAPGKGWSVQVSEQSRRDSPSSARIVQQHCQTIGLRLDFLTKIQTPRFVLQIRHNVLALARAKLVDAIRCLLQLSLLSAGNDDSGAVLDKGLCRHLAEPSRAAGYETDMVFEAEEVGDAKVGGG